VPLRDLSLHILDLVENSIRAGASVISVTVAENREQNTLRIVVEDNGVGLSVPAEVAADPFFTTKKGKRTGLGLSLFRAAAERAGGSMTIEKSALGGVSVEAVMKLDHTDRSPLGDLAATLSSVVCTNPGIELRCRLEGGTQQCEVRVADVAKEFPVGERYGLAVARRVAEKIKQGLTAIGVRE